MNKIIISTTSLLFSVLLSAQTSTGVVPTQSVAVPVKSAVLYLDGAELIHSKSVALNPGRTSIVFTGLTSKLVGKSVQVTTGNPDVSLLSISDKINYLNPAKETARVKSVRDSMEKINNEIEELSAEREAYEKEKEMLMRNISIGGQDKGVVIAELKLAADFYRARLKEINAELFKYNKKMDAKADIVHKLELTLEELNALDKFTPTSEVTILVSTLAKVTTTIELHYITTAGGWTPSYDLKCEDINKPLTLVYRAKVYNNTGIDWDDITLKLSTGDPMKNASKPDLSSWYLNYNEQSMYYNQKKSSGYSNNYSQDEWNKELQSNAPAMNYGIAGKLEEVQAQTKQQSVQQITYEEIQVSDLSAEFDIKEPYSVPSDAKPYIVDVTTLNLNATFRHYAVPKVEREAFMLARITGWEDLDLVEGPCNVYFGGTYVGQSYIDTKSIDDTLDLSLGRDKKVAVSRVQIKDFSKERVVGNSKKITYSYKMIVKNNRKSPITIDLEDQLPVSKQNDITVEQIEISKGQYNKDTGALTWSFTLQPDESKEVILTFAIKYPRDRAVNIKNYKSKYRAKF
jgi:uncharacterized protein (TIGR02231 family)